MRKRKGPGGLDNIDDVTKVSDSDTQSLVNFRDVMPDSTPSYFTSKSIMAQQTKWCVERGFLGNLTLVNDNQQSLSSSLSAKEQNSWHSSSSIGSNPHESQMLGEDKQVISASVADSNRGNPLRGRHGKKKKKPRSELVKSLLKERFEEELRDMPAEKMTQLLENVVDSEQEETLTEMSEDSLTSKVAQAVKEIRSTIGEELEEPEERKGLVSAKVLITSAQQGHSAGSLTMNTDPANANPGNADKTNFDPLDAVHI
jgi:hypothetical protein